MEFRFVKLYSIFYRYTQYSTTNFDLLVKINNEFLQLNSNASLRKKQRKVVYHLPELNPQVFLSYVASIASTLSNFIHVYVFSLSLYPPYFLIFFTWLNWLNSSALLVLVLYFWWFRSFIGYSSSTFLNYLFMTQFSFFDFPSHLKQIASSNSTSTSNNLHRQIANLTPSPVCTSSNFSGVHFVNNNLRVRETITAQWEAYSFSSPCEILVQSRARF